MKLREVMDAERVVFLTSSDKRGALAELVQAAARSLGSLDEDPLTMYLNDVFAVPASLAGLPAMSVPATMNPDGLPLGLQIVGRPFDEQGVLNAGLAIQQRANFDGKPEKWW